MALHQKRYVTRCLAGSDTRTTARLDVLEKQVAELTNANHKHV